MHKVTYECCIQDNIFFQLEHYHIWNVQVPLITRLWYAPRILLWEILVVITCTECVTQVGMPGHDPINMLLPEQPGTNFAPYGR